MALAITVTMHNNNIVYLFARVTMQKVINERVVFPRYRHSTMAIRYLSYCIAGNFRGY